VPSPTTTSTGRTPNLLGRRTEVPGGAVVVPTCETRPVSFDIFLQAFSDGDATSADGDAAPRMLDGWLEDRDGSYARIVTGDGGANVFGVDDFGDGLMINHASGRAVWDVMFDLAHAGGYAVMPIGCPACVISSLHVVGLPDGLREDAVVIESGEDLLRVVEAE
jgi:hypothetical protein